MFFSNLTHRDYAISCFQNCPLIPPGKYRHTWSDNKVGKLIAVKVLQASLPHITAVAFKELPLGSYAPMPVPA
jgi:hypothetical protein